MKKQLIEYFNHLKSKYNSYSYFLPNGGHTFEQKEADKLRVDYYNEMIDAYCAFIDVYSIYCDDVIEKSNNEILISQSMLFYYMMNKEYFASQGEEDDVKNIKHIINQLEPHDEILNYNFFYKREDELIICELCGGEGDIPDCVLCGKPADYNQDRDIKNVKCKIRKSKGPIFNSDDIKLYDEIFCNKCNCAISSNMFKQHCKYVHGGYIEIDDEKNREMVLRHVLIDMCERLGLEEDEINYVLDNYDPKYIDIEYIYDLLDDYEEIKDQGYTMNSETESITSSDTSSENISVICNCSSSNNVSEDENK